VPSLSDTDAAARRLAEREAHGGGVDLTERVPVAIRLRAGLAEQCARRATCRTGAVLAGRH